MFTAIMKHVIWGRYREKVVRGYDNTGAKLQTNALPLETATILSPYRVEGNQLIGRRLGGEIEDITVFFTFSLAFDFVFMRHVELADRYMSLDQKIKRRREK